MKRFIRTVGLAVAVLWLWHSGSAYAAASPRIALVIGNSGYKIAPPLPNPANDARLMAATLRDLGFDVIERIDADRDTILLATFELQDRLIAAGKDAIGLFFYAGHGVQVAGENYFIPLGTEIKQEREVPVKAVSASFVLKQMEFAGNRMNFVILDACRNNPFPASTRATTRGLARMLAPSGSLVAYSTGPGEVAVDGTGDNSPYVLALAEAMRMPGLPAELMFKRVRESVLVATNDAQTPWEESSLKGANFYFSVAEPEAAEAVAQPSLDAAEQAFWQAIKDSGNPSDYRAYLQAYPDGVFAMLAETRAAFFEAERLALAQDDAAEEAIRSATTQTEIELAFWNSIKSSSNAADYTAYLDAYPNGSFAALARARLASTEDAGQKAAELELWQSAEASGGAADYQAYIDAYPNGVYAALARARADAIQAASEDRTTSNAPETEVAALDLQDQVLPTQSIAAETATYDGVWILEIFDRDDRSMSDTVEITISNGKFSVDFRVTRRASGNITGEIDFSGRLLATCIGAYFTCHFSAPYRNGSFQTVAEGITWRWSNTYEPVFEIILTRASP